jgi:hypothetical protein
MAGTVANLAGMPSSAGVLAKLSTVVNNLEFPVEYAFMAGGCCINDAEALRSVLTMLIPGCISVPYLSILSVATRMMMRCPDTENIHFSEIQ